jgi:hypothetical protein
LQLFAKEKQVATESFARMMLIGAVAVLVQVFWPKIVLKKWLNLKSKDLDFGADEDEDDGSDIDDQGWPDFPLHGRHPSASSWSSAAERSLLFPTSHFLSRFFSENCGCDNGDGARRPADGGVQITGEFNSVHYVLNLNRG